MPGAFNPPTRAHLTLARAALEHAGAVLFILPSILPHKEYTGATLEQRTAMLTRLTAGEGRLGTAIADGGLYIDIAREAQALFPGAQIKLLCGRDAAERIVGWSYEDPLAVEHMLEDFELLVAAREGHYDPPPRLRSRIRQLNAPNLDEFSSSRLKDLLARGEDWRPLVPGEIADMVEEIYKV
jgi:nicotinic acid mononucleotide adenylyltransferase